MKDDEILRAAADLLQRKVSVMIHGGIGKPLTQDIAQAMLTAGMMAHTCEFLRDLANAFQETNVE